MSSPISFSGFNNIDFGSIVTALIAQARQPQTGLKTRQLNLTSQGGNFAALSTKLSTLDAATSALANPGSLSGTGVTNSNSAAVTFTAGSDTPLGTYDIKVTELARAQVTASSTAPDTDTTTVATGGTLTIGGVVVTLSGNTTLQGLADAINATDNIGVAASVIQSGTNAHKIVLTGKNTGAANTFSITNGLAGSTLTFGANSVEATDASITLNNVVATSSTNTFANAVTGATITALKKDPAETVTIAVGQDATDGKALVTNLVTAYNDLIAFVQKQQEASNQGDKGTLGHDPILRNVMSTIKQAIGGKNTADSTFEYLSAVGLGFSRTGQLTFDSARFDSAVASEGLTHVQALFSGSGAVSGAFDDIHTAISIYTGADGMVTTQKTNLGKEVASLARQIQDMESRLLIQKTSLERQFYAADQAITRLNNQNAALSSLGGHYRLF